MQSIEQTIEQIQARAAEFRLGRFLLTLVAAPFFVLGWVAKHLVAGVLVVASWIWAAVQVGWSLAAESKGGGS